MSTYSVPGKQQPQKIVKCAHADHINTLGGFGAERPRESAKRVHQVLRSYELVDFLVQECDEEASKFPAFCLRSLLRSQRINVPNKIIIGPKLKELRWFVRTLGPIQTLRQYFPKSLNV